LQALLKRGQLAGKEIAATVAAQPKPNPPEIDFAALLRVPGLSHTKEDRDFNKLMSIPGFETPTQKTEVAPMPELNLGEINIDDLSKILGLAPAPVSDQPAPAPQVISTSNELVARTISETVKAMRLDIHVNDPRGAVESIEHTGLDETVTVVRSGDL
jgi:hypothetical protein